MKKKVLLMILDGWGIAKNTNVSAIDAAKTPYHAAKSPYRYLAVGLYVRDCPIPLMNADSL